MKKLFAITLLGIYLFNFVGYPFLFKVLIQRSDKRLVEKIDRHQYRENELVEIKVALHAPYLSSWTDFERYDGEITIGGVHHNYVKRKVNGDTLYLLCIPNKISTSLYAAKDDFSKNINEYPDGKKAAETAKKVNVLLQYHEKEPYYSLRAPQQTRASHHSSSVILPLQLFIERCGKPPEINS